MSTRTVLHEADIARALTRISHEILESNKGPENLVILGIPTRGVALAYRVAALIAEFGGQPVPVGALDVTMYRDDLHRNPTRAPHPTQIPAGGINGKTVVLVDERGHRELPIRPDFVGKNLPSAREERVNVRLAEVDGAEEVTIES